MHNACTIVNPRNDKGSPVLYTAMQRAVPDFVEFIQEHGAGQLPQALLQLTHADFPPPLGLVDDV